MGSERYRAARTIICDLVPRIIERAAAAGFESKWEWRKRNLTFTGTKESLGIAIARYLPTRQGTSPHWVAHTKHRVKPNLLLVIKMDSSNRKPTAYYVLPRYVIADEHTYFDRRGLFEEYRCKGRAEAIRRCVALGGALQAQSPNLPIE